MISKFYKKKPKALAAFLSAAVLFGAVCPKVFQAYDLDGQNDWQHEAVVPTWQDDKIAEATRYKLVPTGLGFNSAPYPGWREPGGSFWPLGAETFLQKRSGWDNTGFEMFEGRHTYCTGNHINAAGIQPAARAFASEKDYRYTDDELDIFPDAQHGNVKFNFLMLVIACNYPGDYKIPDNTELPSEFAAEQIVSQAIAWFCTNDDSPGFTGDWASDFNLFRHGYTNYEPYNSMMGNFAGRNPEIHAKLHASPNPESAAAKAGMTNNAEAWFWDIWHSTYLTSLLSADWDKGITTYHTAVQERDGEYHAYIDLFATPEAKIYLNGITFEPYGDWQAVGQEADGTYHFVSASGETDENGCIGDLTWPEGKIGALLPIDYTKAHIRTFDTWNANYTSAPGFGHTQTQFASYIEKGLKLYITTQKTSEGDSKVSVNRHEHKETWESNYTVDLHKFDSETGKPLEGSHWDILEMFDDSQLDNTDLDREPDAPGSYESGIGSLNQTEWGDDEISSNYSGDMGVNISDTNKYNWGNDGGTQFERWDNPYNDPCRRDDNVTGKDGQLYEIDSAGVNSGTKAHTDTYNYTYYKGYCDGHPAPEIEYVECDHNEDEDCDCDEINQELHDEVWEAWYAEVEKCEQLVEEGGFFHCIEPGDAAKKAMEEDRDQFYKDFISLTYDYSAEEITAAKGYIIHGTHTDDIPIEWRVVTASEYKDTSEATAIDHNGPSGSGSGETSGTGEPGGGNIGGSGSGSGGGNGDDGNDDDLEDQEVTGTVISVDLDKKIITVENMDLETYTFPYARAEKDGDIEYYSEEEIKVGDTVEVQFRKNREPYPASYIYVYEPDEGGPGMNTLFQEARQISVGLVKETVKAEETAIGSRDTMEAADSSGDTKDTTDGSIDTKEEATGNRQEDTGEDTPENILGDTERSHEDASGQGTEQEVLGGRQEADETATVSEAGRGTTVTSSRKRSSETENGHLDTDKNTHGTDGQTEDEETETEDPEEDILADIDIFEDGAVSLDGSSATASNARPKTEKTQTGLVSQAASRAKGLLRFFGLSDDDGEDEENGDSGSGSYLRNSIPFQPSQANTVKPPASDIIDWTFIVYDHRTEGEIHFNKRDFDLRNDEGTLFDAYAMENGDGTLEGAVYGLFAAEDIVHPDTSAGDDAEQGTGIVFQKGDLVAVATTDRNGDASFMAVTEAPGSVYNYASGSIEHTDWYDVAPKNLHIPEQESAAKERDMESFIGHNPDNSEITAGNGMDLTDTQEGNGTYFKKYSSNQNYDSGMLAGNEVTNSSADTYQDTETTGYYPIQDCESNNGNCWIGRPLLIGPDGSSYYIKELSRSEGYELSVYGKSDVLATNRNAFLEGSDVTTSSGTSQVSGMVSDRENGGTTYSITSADTDQGYIVHLTNIPENATISITSTEGVWDDSVSHYETKLTYTPVAATEGAPVMVGGRTWAAEIGDTIQYNGSEHTVNNVYTITHDRSTVAPDNAEKIENPYLDVSAVTESGNIANDINRLFTKNGYRTPVEGSPWVVVEAESFNLPYVAKAINEQLFTDDWYSAFNAMKMVDNYQLGGHYYIVIAYSYRYAKTSNSIYNEANDKIYVKTAADYSGLSGGKEGYIYRVYDAADCENVERNSNGFVTKATVPNQTASGSAVYHRGDPYGSISFATRENETFWAYAAGETLLDINGEPVLQENREQVSVTPTFVMKVTNVEVTLGSYQQTGTSGDGYGYGDYTYTVSQDTLDGLENGTLKFRITFDQDDSKTSSRKDNFTAKNGHVSISLPLAASGSYIENIVLIYPGQEKTFQDAGTIKNPTGVLERPIRQKVRIEKDIQTLPETKVVWYCLNCGYENQDGVTACGFCNRVRSTEETRSIDYAHDTYAAVHSDNISAERDGGWYETAKDWLGSLLKGNSPEEEPESIGNFRFKAYLKSNLERLYRDEDGHVVWMDRNGNTMTPQYKDTNGDGNYDTFTWKYDTAYGGKTVDFPEKDKVSGDGISDTLAEDAVLLSSNVQKIYTDVEHRTGSMTTSARANNLWDTYADPQDGHRENAGQIEGYTTSERETRSEGDAVTTNASLYSYDGILRDRDRSDYLQDEQNHGYTRLLETQRVQIEDGTELINHEAYNYEKFFDAIRAANTDIWDNDMHSTFTGSSMSNYPGQHWFETFYEKYQLDDTDKDYTLANTDGADKDGTAGGDRDTSFKPFRWIREHVFGDRDGYIQYPAVNNGENMEVVVNTSDQARANANASDAVRQFAVKWYLEDEAAKLMVDNGLGENIAKPDGKIGYDEAVYDMALFEAIAKAYNYLRPFYYYDLDTIYSVEWDSAPGGGADKDYTTLSADERLDDRYYNISSYLPYGVYVIVEQPPMRRDDAVNDWKNRSFDIEKPKEVIVPSVYDGPESNNTTDNYHAHYNFNADQLLTDQAKQENYLIRFGEENSANTSNQDDREFVIRAHGYHGDFEVYKYGLDIDRLQASITAPNGDYSYGGWDIAQEEHDPLKDYYENDHRGEEGVEEIRKENGGNDASRYHGFDTDVTANGNGAATANGTNYNGEALRKRFFYGSIAEDDGVADQVLFKDGAVDENNASGMSWHNGVKSTTGELTAYDGKYSAALVPWTMTAPADSHVYSAEEFSGYADVNERNRFYTTMLRINKTDSETGEYIVHDDAIFGIYAASRYNSFAEIEEDSKLIEDPDERAKFLMQFKPGDAKFYLQDTVIMGSREFLEAMKARDLTPFRRRTALNESMEDPGHLYSGIVPKGTPVCIESERIDLYDGFGDRTGQMTVWSTRADIKMDDPETQNRLEYGGQNVGYFKTSQPIGAGVYVLAEIKPPDGYVRSKPVAIEVYSDRTTYYADGDMYAKVDAVRYEANLLDEYPYK